MSRCRFLATWIVEAEIDRVRKAIDDASRRPRWRRGVERVEVLGRRAASMNALVPVSRPPACTSLRFRWSPPRSGFAGVPGTGQR